MVYINFAFTDFKIFYLYFNLKLRLGEYIIYKYIKNEMTIDIFKYVDIW